MTEEHRHDRATQSRSGQGTPHVTLEGFLQLYAVAPLDVKVRALILATGVLLGQAQTEAEPFLGLKGLGEALNFHPTTLWRLGVPEHCDEGFGGRPRYRLSRVLEYLRSEACQRHRAIMRAERLARSKKENGNECGI